MCAWVHCALVPCCCMLGALDMLSQAACQKLGHWCLDVHHLLQTSHFLPLLFSLLRMSYGGEMVLKFCLGGQRTTSLVVVTARTQSRGPLLPAPSCSAQGQYCFIIETKAEWKLPYRAHPPRSGNNHRHSGAGTREVPRNMGHSTWVTHGCCGLRVR